SGPALPDSAKMISLAGRGDRLLAIAITGGTRRASSAPSSAPAMNLKPDAEASGATQPSTAPAPERLTLFEFDGATWKRLVDLPEDVAPRTAEPTLALIDGRPTIAVTGNN